MPVTVIISILYVSFRNFQMTVDGECIGGGKMSIFPKGRNEFPLFKRKIS